MGNIKLEYLPQNAEDNRPNIIAIDIPAADQAYAWKVPEVLGEEFKIKITSLNNPAINDETDDISTIKSGIALLRPQGNEMFIVGTQEEINWRTYGDFDRVNLYYSTDAGLTYPHTIVTDLSNIGAFSWTVPDTPGIDIKVRVEACADDSVFSRESAGYHLGTIAPPDDLRPHRVIRGQKHSRVVCGVQAVHAQVVPCEDHILRTLGRDATSAVCPIPAPTSLCSKHYCGQHKRKDEHTSGHDPLLSLVGLPFASLRKDPRLSP